MLGEQHHLADRLADLETIALRAEEARQPLGRHVGDALRGVVAFAGENNRVRAQVGGKDLQRVAGALGQRLERFLEHDRERIRLFTGRTADHPGAQRAGLDAAREQRGHHRVVQFLPHRRVAEEAGDADQHLVEQQVELLRVAAQEGFVGGQRVQAVHRQTPLDAAQQRAGLVQRQVVFAALAQQSQDGTEGLLCGYVRRRRQRRRRSRARRRNVQDALRQFGHRRDDVHTPRRDGRLGHRVELRRVGLLRQRQAALRFDGQQAQRAVRTHARQHHADRPIALRTRERREQHVDRQPQAARLHRNGDVQHAQRDAEFAVRRDHIDDVGLHAHRLGGLAHRHRGRALQQFGQHRLVRRVQVLHDDVRQPAGRRHLGEELLQRVQPAGGRAQPDDARRGRFVGGR